LKDFRDVCKGDFGGYIESENNLAQDDPSWVYADAMVCGNATVFGEVKVSEHASVSGEAKISGNARIFGEATVTGNSSVFGNAQIFGRAWVYGSAWVYGDARVRSEAKVHERARVYGNALVSGRARVYGNAAVAGDTELSGDAEVSGEEYVAVEVVDTEEEVRNMNAEELFKRAEEIAEGAGGPPPTREEILAVAKIMVQCQQREFQEKGLAKIEGMAERYFEDRAAPVPPLPVFRASGGSSPESDLTTGLVTLRERPRETEHALLYTDAYGVTWFTLFDEEEDGEKERQRLDEKGCTVLAVYDIWDLPKAEADGP